MKIENVKRFIRSSFFFIFLVIISFIGGAALAVVLDLGTVFSQSVMLPLARKLDTDLIHLKNGKLIEGRILSKTALEILVAVDQGTVKFRPDEIESFQENEMARYFKKAW